jgi:dTDP-glucose pyrophosphorylase
MKYRNTNLNVVIPMAGAGSRFAQVGYAFPKPLISVKGKPMIQVVIENLNIEAQYTFLVRGEHIKKYGIDVMLDMLVPKCNVIPIDETTEGAACTVMRAAPFIDNDSPLFMANSDQFVEWNANLVMNNFINSKSDGGMIIFDSVHPKNSFVKIGSDGFATEVAEKKVISHMATNGLYFWQHGSDFVRYAEQMIRGGRKTNGEYYVAPVYQEAINDDKKFIVQGIDKHWPIGIPEDLDYFLANYRGEI